jgi:formylglycine-generating enzyme required for sulfatase activity
MKTRLLLLSMICSFASFANAAPPVVSGVTASQRAGSKIVDISYNVTMDAGQTAFVELWFSPDNGLNFPIRCLDITGDVDANVSAGVGKSVEWNAESDWDQQFTANGKIRVIATYGDQASGFTGSGEGGNAGQAGGQADTSLMTAVLDSLITSSGDQTSEMKAEAGVDVVKVDATEVTNEKWNQVVNWSLSNGYSGLPLGPDVNATHPRTDVSFWEAIKWCNARSEMDGLEPAYRTAEVEPFYGDFNNDGIIQMSHNHLNGSDNWNSYSQDTNQNGRYDPGEPYDDNNNNGIVELDEYQDLNGNDAYDPPATPFRTGLSFMNQYSQRVGQYIDFNATGYRLIPLSVMKKLASGGNSGKMWPWGDSNPDQYANFATEYRVYLAGGMAPPFQSPSPATERSANGYGLFDMIGNVGEHTENQSFSGQGMVAIYGGSYLGFQQWHPDPLVNVFPRSANDIYDLWADIEYPQKSPAIGFRCMIKAN